MHILIHWEAQMRRFLLRVCRSWQLTGGWLNTIILRVKVTHFQFVTGENHPLYGIARYSVDFKVSRFC